MLTNQRIEDIDQLLNELERQAQSNLPGPQFFSHLLQRLRFLLEANSAAVLAPTGSAWISIAQSGDVDDAVANDFSSALEASAATNPTLNLQTLMGISGDRRWYATPLRPANFAKGCLLVTLDREVPPSAIPGMLELMAAFSEVLALRQMSELEHFLDNRWEKLTHLCATLLDASFDADGGKLLVNQLVSIFGAARVSLANASSFGSVTLETVSGTPTLDLNSKVVHTLTQLATPTFKSRKPVVRQQRQNPVATNDSNGLAEDGAFANAISLPLLANSKSKRCDSVIVIEFQSYAEMVAATATISHILPTLSLAWQQHRRWNRLPRVIRFLGERRLALAKWKSRAIVSCVLILLAGLAYIALKSPYPLTIEAAATLEPRLHKTIFTNLDGYIEELLVDDGQLVEVGTQLARVRSPELELRIEQLVGEMRTLNEKRSALQIASNQLNLDAADSLVNQNRLASEIKQLDAQEGNLNSQLSLLNSEKQKSIITSSIRGTVVAKDITQQLASRPLRRGDALFRIVDLDGPWHLKIQVADRDSGYVLNLKLAPAHKPLNKDMPIRFVLDSIPGEQFDAHVTWISNSVQNTGGTGGFVEMHAAVDKSVIDRAHMGASARAYFHCGEQPTWFVWCRPLVEAIQRRLWFWS